MSVVMSDSRRKRSEAADKPADKKEPPGRPRFPLDLDSWDELEVLKAALSFRAAALVKQEYRLLGNSEMAVRILKEALRKEIEEVLASRRK